MQYTLRSTHTSSNLVLVEVLSKVLLQALSNEPRPELGQWFYEAFNSSAFHRNVVNAFRGSKSPINKTTQTLSDDL